MFNLNKYQQKFYKDFNINIIDNKIDEETRNKLKDKSTIENLYNEMCNDINYDKEFKNIKYILTIGDIHGDFKMLIYILKSYCIIKPIEKNNNFYKLENYKPKYEYEYELNYNYSLLNNFVIIQVGDQLKGIRYGPNKSYKDTLYINEEEKVLDFMNVLREQAKELNENENRNVYVISLIGNHEYINLENFINKKCKDTDIKCKEYNKFIKDEKENIICGRYFMVSINGFIFAHCGVIKSLIIDLDKMFPKLDIINNLEKIDNLNDKIKYFDIIVRILMLIKINKIEKEEIDKKFDNNTLLNLVNNKYLYNKSKLSSNIIDLYEIFHMDNIVIGHNMIYDGIDKTNIKIENIDKNINVYNVDTGLSNSFLKLNKDKIPDYSYKTFLFFKTNPAKNNHLIKQVLFLEFDEKNNLKQSNFSNIEFISTKEPYINEDGTFTNKFSKKIYDYRDLTDEERTKQLNYCISK